MSDHDTPEVGSGQAGDRPLVPYDPDDPDEAEFLGLDAPTTPEVGSGQSEAEREVGGRLVREVWIEWAREQPAPKPSWLVPWEGLSEPDREVDRRIAERLTRDAADRLAAVEAERDHANASQAETWRYVCEIAQKLGIEPDDGHPMDAVDRMTARAESAEAERDTALREVAERDARLAKVAALADEWSRRENRTGAPYATAFVNGYHAAAVDLRAALDTPDGGGQ